MAVVIEITFSVRLVQKTVEITKVVVRSGKRVILWSVCRMAADQTLEVFSEVLLWSDGERQAA